MMLTKAPEPIDIVSSRPKKARSKVLVRPAVLKQAIHHLQNFMTFVPAMARGAEQQADPKDRPQVRKGFMQLFGEIITTTSALAEAIDPAGSAEVAKALEGIRASEPYQQLVERMERDRIAALYQWDEYAQVLSVGMPTEVCYEVALHQPCADFGGWLLGKFCRIGPHKYVVLAAEYAPLKPPFSAGDKIRLVVRAVDEHGNVADSPTVKEAKDGSETSDARPANEDGAHEDAQRVDQACPENRPAPRLD